MDIEVDTSFFRIIRSYSMLTLPRLNFLLLDLDFVVCLMQFFISADSESFRNVVLRSSSFLFPVCVFYTAMASNHLASLPSLGERASFD